MTESNGDESVRAGVVGVGSMGRHHARVYADLEDATLVGIHDADIQRAGEVAANHGTTVMDRDALLEAADVVSVAVPTEYHYAVTRDCIERGIHTLVEKPFVENLANGRDLLERARERDVRLGVGHVERFNPAVDRMAKILGDETAIAVDAERLGPSVDRELSDTVVMDLMIHDIDVLLALFGDDIASVGAMAAEEPYVTAQLDFADGPLATLTASRTTEKKVRRLRVTAEHHLLELDYVDQTIRMYRRSVPEYLQENGDVRFRHSEIVDRPIVEGTEPLEAELASFVEAVRTGRTPEVSGEDGLRAIQLARRIERRANLTDDGVDAEVSPVR